VKGRIFGLFAKSGGQISGVYQSSETSLFRWKNQSV